MLLQPIVKLQTFTVILTCPQADFVQTPDFDILITGVGMTATAYSLGKHLQADYNLVLNLGIAGCFDHSIRLGSVLNIVADEFSELGAKTGMYFFPLTSWGLEETNSKAPIPRQRMHLTIYHE